MFDLTENFETYSCMVAESTTYCKVKSNHGSTFLFLTKVKTFQISAGHYRAGVRASAFARDHRKGDEGKRPVRRSDIALRQEVWVIGTSGPLTGTDRDLISAHPLFETLEAGSFEALISQCRSMRFRRNEMIFHAGDDADSFYIVASGTVRLFRLDANGDEVPVNVFQAAQSFAEAAVFREAKYPVSAQALETSRLVRLAAKPIVARIKAEPKFALGALESMSRHLKLLVEEIVLLRAPTARLRVAKFLLRLSPVRNGGCCFDLPYSKLVIAERLGMKPETLSRAFADLRAVGVSVKRQTVTISSLGNLWDLEHSAVRSKHRDRSS